MIVCSGCKQPHILDFETAVLTKDGNSWIHEDCVSKDVTKASDELLVPDDLEMPDTDKDVPKEVK